MTEPVVDPDPSGDPKLDPSGDPKLKVQPDPDPADKTVAYATYQRSVTQEKNLRDKLKTTDDLLKKYQDAEKDEKEKKQVEAGEHKQIIDSRDEEIVNLKGQLKTANTDLDDGVKMAAFLDKLPGAPRSNKIMAFMPLDEIPMVDGIPDPVILEKKANEFAKEWGEFIGPASKKKLPNDDASTPSDLSLEDWKKLPVKEQRKRYQEMRGNYLKNRG